METLQVLFIASLIVNVIILITIFVLYQNQKRVLDITPFIKKIDRLRIQTAGKEQKILEEALDKSKATVEETLEGLEGVEELSEEAREDLKKQSQRLVKESISKDSEVFQITIKDITETYKQELKNFHSTQKEEYSKLLSSAKALINEDLTNLRKELTRLSDEERSKVQEEISYYKNSLKNELDDKIFSIVSDVARQTIGESIDVSKHEELVLRSLNKAKNERFF